MERAEQIVLALEPLLLAELESDTQRLTKSIEQRADMIVDELSDSITAALNQAVIHQEANRKGPITYISFSMLLSNILMDNHGFQVAAFDERFFVDMEEAIADWRPAYIFSGIQRCMDSAASVIKQRIPRLRPYELIESKHAFSMNYYGIATQILMTALPQVLENLTLPTLKKADKVLVVTGLYMEKQDCIYVWE